MIVPLAVVVNGHALKLCVSWHFKILALPVGFVGCKVATDVVSLRIINKIANTPAHDCRYHPWPVAGILLGCTNLLPQGRIVRLSIQDTHKEAVQMLPFVTFFALAVTLMTIQAKRETARRQAMRLVPIPTRRLRDGTLHRAGR